LVLFLLVISYSPELTTNLKENDVIKNLNVFQMLLFIGVALLFSTSVYASETSKELLLESEIQWSPLNPARGDKSPQAGQLWGDRKTEGPSGFLVKFVDGFSSPPHIHNVTYKGVVISGHVHNDDPEAANMWMPAGSFWTQPAGEAHITSAKGNVNIAYIEIEDGPYLVKHSHEQFDNGERPVNIDPSNLVWLDEANTNWISDNGAEITHLWGDLKEGQLNGSFIKLPEGFSGSIQNKGTDFRAIVISGQITYQDTPLNVGSYFGSAEPKAHKLSTAQEAFIYVRTNGRYKITN